MLFGTVTVPEIVPLLPEDLLLQGGPGVEGENVLLTQVDQLLPVEHTNSVSVTKWPFPNLEDFYNQFTQSPWVGSDCSHTRSWLNIA